MAKRNSIDELLLRLSISCADEAVRVAQEALQTAENASRVQGTRVRRLEELAGIAGIMPDDVEWHQQAESQDGHLEEEDDSSIFEVSCLCCNNDKSVVAPAEQDSPTAISETHAESSGNIEPARQRIAILRIVGDTSKAPRYTERARCQAHRNRLGAGLQKSVPRPKREKRTSIGRGQLVKSWRMSIYARGRVQLRILSVQEMRVRFKIGEAQGYW
ncbi:hypothetical protein BCR34DRAFT_585512 [Clohesyomyces aquaticus]|uniref:Uncharacterized protein n=1 Tax=Clohesyomyces aquaticus TaxID=1231657 RepID=A0A1Y1ZY90_9PLEO|nr:hypothetical protein BCR34DRAFT_585512 [Clohesyomyces aquaticus]